MVIEDIYNVGKNITRIRSDQLRHTLEALTTMHEALQTGGYAALFSIKYGTVPWRLPVDPDTNEHTFATHRISHQWLPTSLIP